MKVTEFLEIIGEKVRNQLPVPFGVYDINTSYTCTEFVAPLVLHDGIYYILNVEGIWLGSSQPTESNNPKTDIQVNGVNAKWMAAENMKFAFVEILMANFAKLASAVFSGDHMFSQQGIDANGNATSDYSGFGTDAFTPNIELDFLTGIARLKKLVADGAELTNVKGMTGSFRTLQCINSSGAVVGSISFDPSGSMWFSGDLYHQGVKDGRALRFYAANLNVRGSLGARQMNTVVVVGSQARYYPNGYGTYDEYTIINLTASQNTSGETYYTIPLYSPTGMEGISFNNVLLASTSTSTFRYVLLAAAGCNVTVVNTNDNGVDNTRIVYANGKPHSIQGGSCADLICVRPEDMTPTPASNILGRGWLYRGYFDNDWR